LLTEPRERTKGAPAATRRRARRLVVLGGGLGGTMIANRLRRRFPADQLEIHVVDRDDRHLYQAGLIFVPFGMVSPERLVRPRRRQLQDGIAFHEAEIESVSLEDDRVLLADGASLDYDALVVATGVELQPEETEGLAGPGWGEKMLTFYSLQGATALRDRLAGFDGGRLLLNVVDMPIKCPIAPLEFVFLADRYLRKRGVRERTEIVFSTPLDGAFTKPIASKHFAGILEEKGIELVTEFNAGEADGEKGVLTSYDGRELEFDLLVSVPLHGGAAFMERSPGLADALGFVTVDKGTLRSTAKPNVFSLGDTTDVPTSKAGSVTHFEGEVLTENLERFLAGEEPCSTFDGHANCFIETGFQKALLIDFNYDQEPLPGRFPGRLGLPLLQQSRLNHLGKLGFEWLYWHALLPGRDIPRVHSAMPVAGKRFPKDERRHTDDVSDDRRPPRRSRWGRLLDASRAVD
jgi:sulfide:quinone oxidoreductase